MGWLPDQGFLKNRWDIYSELTTMYLLAIGSPTHPVPAGAWESVQRPVVSYGGIDYISGAAPLFIHQYPQAWCRLPQPAGPPRQLLHQLHCRHPGAPVLVPGAGAEISLDRSGYVGHFRLRFPAGLSCLGWAAFDWAARRNPGALRRRRIAGFSARRMFSCLVNHAGKIWR